MISAPLMGDAWPAIEPGSRISDYGKATLAPIDPCEVRSFQTLAITYTVGRFGLDDTGAIRIAQRFSYDGGALQTYQPEATNYVSATTSGDAALTLLMEPHGYRPWDLSLRITVRDGVLREGDVITVVYGDRSFGSPGLRMQTFCESAFQFKVSVDVCATGHFHPLNDDLCVPIIPAKPHRWQLILPTLRRPGETFTLGIKAEDLWGNPTDQIEGRFQLHCDPAIEGLPETFNWSPGARSTKIAGLKVAQPGTHKITLKDASGTVLGTSNLLVGKDTDKIAYWGDLHGQSGETAGINTIDEYFAFARDLSFLDVTAHQGNDFQITTAFWDHLNKTTKAFNQEGTFIVFPGYEWSGNTATGGDHNVFFRHEGRPIRRSSHALLNDRSDIAHDANSSGALFDALEHEDCVLFAHVGGRPADLGLAHAPKLRTAVEIHSDWGTFEWMMTDSFALGHRVGLVCNSDGHTGRPGASYPGATCFGTYGGLTCFLTDELSRASIFECLRRRHHYGTTGNRLHLDVRARFAQGAHLFERDPNHFNAEPQHVQEAMMGDIVQVDDEKVQIAFEIASPSPIERVDIMNGKDVVKTLRSYGHGDLGERFRLLWSGAERRGRGRQTKWHGLVKLDGAKIARMARINAWNHELPIELLTDQTISFEAATTGNFGGVDVWLDDTDSARISFESNQVSGSVALNDVGLDDVCFAAGGLAKQIAVRRLPDTLSICEMERTVFVDVEPGRDNPIWLRVTTLDGHQAWSSPLYLYR